LFKAVENGHAHVAVLLLKKGAGVNQAKNDGDTPLMVAASSGKKGVLTLLLFWGADKAAKSGAGKNALDLAR
jgi:ankyrin repeat protein